MKETFPIKCPLCGDIIDVPVELERLEFGEPAMRGDDNYLEVKWRTQMITHEHLKVKLG